MPLYHDMGLIGCLLSALYYPAPLVLIPPENFLAGPALWLRAISRNRIGGAQLRLFPLCSADQGRGAGRSRPVLLAKHFQRQDATP